MCHLILLHFTQFEILSERRLWSQTLRSAFLVSRKYTLWKYRMVIITFRKEVVNSSQTRTAYNHCCYVGYIIKNHPLPLHSFFFLVTTMFKRYRRICLYINVCNFFLCIGFPNTLVFIALIEIDNIYYKNIQYD